MAAATLALLLTAPPYAGREARAELDMALAAAAMDRSLEVYWLDNALLQLAANRQVEQALLPPGLKGWAALPEMGETRQFVEAAAWSRCEALGIRVLLPVEPLDENEFRRRWRACEQVLVL